MLILYMNVVVMGIVIRVLRRFIPKGQLTGEITDDELIRSNWYLNSWSLKCLNWRTPIEFFS